MVFFSVVMKGRSLWFALFWGVDEFFVVTMQGVGLGVDRL